MSDKKVSYVSYEPLREIFLESGLSSSEVARRIGWVNGTRRPDNTRVQRVLGIKPYRIYNGSPRFYASVTEKTARDLCSALMVDYDVVYREHMGEEAGTCACGEQIVEADPDHCCGFCRAGLVA